VQLIDVWGEIVDYLSMIIRRKESIIGDYLAFEFMIKSNTLSRSAGRMAECGCDVMGKERKIKLIPVRSRKKEREREREQLKLRGTRRCFNC
jgi:hypothetical protein